MNLGERLRNIYKRHENELYFWRGSGNICDGYLDIPLEIRYIKVMKKEERIYVYIDNNDAYEEFEVEESILDLFSSIWIDKEFCGSEYTLPDRLFRMIWKELGNGFEEKELFVPCYLMEECLYIACIENYDKVRDVFEIESCCNEKRESMFIREYPILYFRIKHMLFDFYFEKKDVKWRSIIGCGNMIETVKVINNIFQYFYIPGLELFQELSNMLYEGSPNIGVIDFVEKPERDNKEIYFEDKCVLCHNDGRIIRKYLQMSNDDMHLIAEWYNAYEEVNQCWFIAGMGKCGKRLCQIQFEGNAKWSCAFKDEIILYNGIEYELYHKRRKERKDSERRIKNEQKLKDVFAKANAEKLCALIDILKEQKHGTMLVVITEAEKEAERLGKIHRAIRVDKFQLATLKKEQILAIASIDGCILIDDDGYCFAIGAILDGDARAYSNLGRGARYNSSLAYLYNMSKKNINAASVVISEDGMVDIMTTMEAGNYEDENDLYRMIVREDENSFYNDRAFEFQEIQMWGYNY